MYILARIRIKFTSWVYTYIYTYMSRRGDICKYKHVVNMRHVHTYTYTSCVAVCTCMRLHHMGRSCCARCKLLLQLTSLHVAVCCSALRCVAVCCSVLQCVAVCCSVLQCVAMCCSVLQCVAVAVRCSVLQCCSVLGSFPAHVAVDITLSLFKHTHPSTHQRTHK